MATKLNPSTDTIVIHNSPNMNLTGGISISIDGNEATLKTKFEKKNTFAYGYELTIYAKSKTSANFATFTGDELNNKSCTREISAKVELNNDGIVYIGIKCTAYKGSDKCTILGNSYSASNNSGDLYRIEVGYAPKDPSIKVASKEIKGTKCNISVKYSYTDGKPSCSTKWIKCYNESGNEVSKQDITNTSGTIKFSGLTLGKKYKFKLHVENTIGSKEAECSASVGIPTVKVYMSSDKKWHNAIAKIYMSGEWHTAIPMIYSNNAWKRTKNKGGI